MSEEYLTLSTGDFWYLNKIVAQLYEEAEAEDHAEKALRNFLENLKELIPFEKGEIYFCNYTHDNISYEDFIFYGWSKEDLDTYHKEEVYKMDEVLPMVANPAPVVFRSTDVFIQSEREQSKYYKDVVSKVGMQQSVEGNIFFEDDELSGISLHRSEDHPDFTPKAIEAVRFVRPHLINISKRYRKDKNTPVAEALSATIPDFEMHDISYCIFDEDLKTVRAEITPIVIEYNELYGYGNSAEVISQLASKVQNKMKVLNEKGEATDEFAVGEHSYFMDMEKLEGENGEVLFKVVCHDFTRTIDKMLMEITDKFNLTAREHEVLKCIISGFDTAEIAEKLFVSIPTAKKHLNNIYQKLNIKGRHQVISVMLQSDSYWQNAGEL